jgi:hypothetical protein
VLSAAVEGEKVEVVAVQAPVKKVEKEGPAEEAPMKTEGTAGAGWGFQTGRPLPPDRFPMRVTHVAPAPGESTSPVPPLWPLCCARPVMIF